MGLIVNVYRSPLGDCTNGGISGKHNRLCVVNASGPFNPSEDCPAVKLESHRNGILRIVPVDPESFLVDSNKWYMMGGNYASTSDSRFAELAEILTGRPFYGAVAIHDRME